MADPPGRPRTLHLCSKSGPPDEGPMGTLWRGKQAKQARHARRGGREKGGRGRRRRGEGEEERKKEERRQPLLSSKRVPNHRRVGKKSGF